MLVRLNALECNNMIEKLRDFIELYLIVLQNDCVSLEKVLESQLFDNTLKVTKCNITQLKDNDINTLAFFEEVLQALLSTQSKTAEAEDLAINVLRGTNVDKSSSTVYFNTEWRTVGEYTKYVSQAKGNLAEVCKKLALEGKSDTFFEKILDSCARSKGLVNHDKFPSWKEKWLHGYDLCKSAN